MIDSFLVHLGLLRWVFYLAVLFVFVRYMNAEGNPLEWWHFISSRSADGTPVADINKLGQITGIIVGSMSILQISGGAKDNPTGFALVLTAYFSYVGGVAGYAAFLRSKSTSRETTITAGPAAAPPAPQKVTATITEPQKEESQ